MARTFARSSSDIADKGSPIKVMDPLEGLSRPAIRPSSVDLPDPEEPTMAIDSPWDIERLILLMIWIVWWFRSTDCCNASTVMAGSLTMGFDPLCGIVFAILTKWMTWRE